MIESQAILKFAIAVAIGALVGTERERHFGSKDRATFAGVRSFAIVCLLGAVCGYLADPLGPWIVAIGLLAVAGFTIVTFATTIRICEGDIGTTTELAFILTFVIGVMLVVASMSLGIALGITLTVLLSLKGLTRKLSKEISREDIYATLKFAMIALVILPFLSKETFDPWHVLSFYNVWLMVVIVSAISFSGYMATKWFGGSRGLGLTALLGGLWSSTASTMTFSTRGRQNPASYSGYAMAVLIACSTMFPRQIVEVYLVSGTTILPQVIIPLGIMGLMGLGISAFWYYRTLSDKESQVEMTNPFSLTPALKFAAIYSVVLMLSKAAQIHFGSTGVYAAALLSGLVDVNAITLSVAHLAGEGKMAAPVAVKAVVLAGAANTVVKCAITWIFGTRKMFFRVLPWFALILIAGILAVFWMGG